MDTNIGNTPGKMIAVDIELPASILVKVENRCGRRESPGQRISSFVSDWVLGTPAGINRPKRRVA